jgi:hypothetical protein
MTRQAQIARCHWVARLSVAAAVAQFGCSHGSPSLPGYAAESQVKSGTGPIATGAACTADGAQVECGNVVRDTPDYTVCAMGLRTCKSGVWSSCVATGQRQIKGHHEGLAVNGANSKCTFDNPCDPFCNEINDDPNTLVPGADAGYVVDAGVILKLIPIKPGSSSSCTSLHVTASSSTLSVNQLSPVTTSPAQLTVSAQLQPPSCYPKATPVLWSIDRTDIATIDASGKLTLITPISTPIVVTGHSGTFTDTATVQVNVNVVDNHLAPSGTVSGFAASSTAADTVKLLYPYAQTVLPLGLPAPLLQWDPGTTGAASAVKISLRYTAATGASFIWSAIVPENSTLQLDPNDSTNTLAAGPRATVDSVDSSVWKLFERTALGNDAAIVIQRLAGASPGTLRNELSTTIHFASNQLKGTVYYHSYGTNQVENFGKSYPNGMTKVSQLSPPPPLSTASAPTQSIGANQLFGAATLMMKPGDTAPSVAAGYSTGDTTGKGCRVCHNASSTAQTPVLLTNLYPNTDRTSAIFRLGIDAANAGLVFPNTPNQGKYSWGAVYPDGTKMLSSSGPNTSFRTASPPGGLDGSDNGAFTNALYSLDPATLGTMITTPGMPPVADFHAALPAFSIDGKKVAFNYYAGTNACKDASGANYSGDKHSLATIDFDPTASAFSNCRVILKESGACNSSYPSNSPCTDVWPAFLPTTSGDYGIVFEREVVNNGSITGHNTSDFGGTRAACDYYPGPSSYKCGDQNAVNDGSKGELWLLTSNATTPKSVRLSAANGTNASGTYIPTGSNNHTAAIEPVLNYEPTTAPQLIGGYYWVAFTSRRLYGNVATVNPWWSDPRWAPIGGQYGPTTKKIWVSAVDGDAVTKAGAGTDPSHPPFYLPGQELLAGNAKAYWSIPACIQPNSTTSANTLCDSNLDCCGATASPATSICALDIPLTNPPVRHCIPLSTSSCIADNSTTPCSIDAQCCNNVTLGSLCVNNKCQPPPPVYVYQADQFHRDYQATCSNPEQMPVWRELQWMGSIPSGTSVDFFVQTAKNEAGPDPDNLDAAPPPVLLQSATSANLLGWTTSAKAVAQVLLDAGLAPRSFIRLTIKLNPSADGQSTPTITDWRQLFDCKDAV